MVEEEEVEEGQYSLLYIGNLILLNIFNISPFTHNKVKNSLFKLLRYNFALDTTSLDNYTNTSHIYYCIKKIYL